MNDPLISVIIPVYNTEKYIKRCIQSIQDNSYKNLEIICVNDGSKDGSLAVLQSLAQQDHRIKVIDKVNGGVSSARNAGLDIASGDYISFIDSDDWIHPEFFSVLMAEAIRNKAGITVAQVVNVYEGQPQVQHVEVPANKDVRVLSAREALSQDGYLRRSVWGRLITRNVIDDVRFPIGIQFGEDMVFNTMIIKNDSTEFVFIDVPLIYYYHGRTDSLVCASSYTSHYVLGCWIIDHLEHFYLRDIATLSALSSILTYRYTASFFMGVKAHKIAKPQLKKCMKALRRDRNCPLLAKIKSGVFSAFPFTYRMIRILTDPTFRSFEKYTKKQVAAQKKSGQ